MLAPLAPHFASELWSAFVDNASKKTTDFDWVLTNNYIIYNTFLFKRFINPLFQSKSVLEQRWPQVDSNYPLELSCIVNTQECCAFKIPRSQLDQLDETAALEFLQKNDIFIKYHGGSKILKKSFLLYPGLKATLELVTEQKKKNVVMQQ